MVHVLAVCSVLAGLPTAEPLPVPLAATASRVVVAPFCGLSSHNPDFSQTLAAEIARYCNGIYYAPWLFLERTPSHLVLPNEYDPTELRYLLGLSVANALPCILTLHWGPTGQPDMMEWIATKYAPSVLWQVNLDGSLARHPTDPFANLPCLLHPGLRAEIVDTYTDAVEAAKAHPGYGYVLALGGTTEPMIARGDLTQADDCRPSGFCFNPAHVSWWHGELESRWSDIAAFNAALGTSYAAFGEVLPPTSVEPSPLYAEYERGLRRALIDYEAWQQNLMRGLEPERPLLNHIASVLTIVSGGVRGSCTTFDAGSVQPGVPGGSVYTVPNHIADYAAIQMDGHRAFDRQAFAAIELGILGTWDGRGEEYKVWYAMMAARFRKVWSAPYAWYGGGSNLRESDAKEGLLWGTLVGGLDVGEPRLPAVALFTNYSAWSWDCPRARGAQLEAYRQLFHAGVDRVLVSEFQVEDGWLADLPVRALVLADPFCLSRRVLDALNAAQQAGLQVFLLGAAPQSDTHGKPLPSAQVDTLLRHPNTVRVQSAAVLPGALVERLGLANCLPGFEVVETDRGLCVVNVSHCRNAVRVTTPPEPTTVRLTLGHRAATVPVQYFTFVDPAANETHWIDTAGTWHHEPPAWDPEPSGISAH